MVLLNFRLQMFKQLVVEKLPKADFQSVAQLLNGTYAGVQAVEGDTPHRFASAFTQGFAGGIDRG